MNLQPRTEPSIVDGREFLRNAVGVEYKTAGITLDRAAFTGDRVKGGTAVYRAANGLFAPVTEATTAPIDGACLTAHGVPLQTGVNPVVGAITKAYARRDRCTGVTAAFEEATRNRIVFDL